MLDAARTGWILLVPRLRRVGSTRRVARSLSKPRRNVWDVWRDRAWPVKRDTGDQVPAVGPVDRLADAEARRVGGHQRAGPRGWRPGGRRRPDSARRPTSSSPLPSTNDPRKSMAKARAALAGPRAACVAAMVEPLLSRRLVRRTVANARRGIGRRV